MDMSIFTILAQDGVTSGAIYVLMALALVLVYSITRVIFIPLGEFAAYGALSLAAIQEGKFPQTALLLVWLGAACFIQELVRLWRCPVPGGAGGRNCLIAFLWFVILPGLVLFAARKLSADTLAMPLQVLLTFAIVAPMGPMLYRLAFQPVAEASVLVLLIVAVALHFAMMGTGLYLFGAEGFRTRPFSAASLELGSLQVSGQSMVVMAVAVLLIIGLYLYFDRTLPGKALRATAVNRLGARLVGIGTTQAGRLAFLLASSLGTLCGILIAPMTTMYYDSGFLMGLKGFVGAIVGGLASYPVAAAGALLVGLLESYSSYWASAYKEVIVFTLIIPVLLWRSLAHPGSEGEH